MFTLVYGTGVLGDFAAGSSAGRSPRRTLVVISLVLSATVGLLPLLGGSVKTAAVLLAVWGLSYGGVCVSAETWLLAGAPHAREAASSLFVGVFDRAIALGALVGGLEADGTGIEPVLWIGGALAAGSAVSDSAPGAPPRADASRYIRRPCLGVSGHP
ncbi:MFS transporter [Streptomyces sp. QHH-9511]|uniref:MFS transporter n=1 Tax=Streptomyces sp. QHH-9511 TaxID=2684468 RepID=UPI0018E0BF8B